MSVFNKIATLAKAAGNVVASHPKTAAAVAIVAVAGAVYVKTKRKAKAPVAAAETPKPQASADKPADSAAEMAAKMAAKAKAAASATKQAAAESVVNTATAAKTAVKEVKEAVKTAVNAVVPPAEQASETVEFNGPQRPADGVPMHDDARVEKANLDHKAEVFQKEMDVRKDPNVITVNNVKDITKATAQRARRGENVGDIPTLEPIPKNAPPFVRNPEPRKDISDVEVNIPPTPQEIAERAAKAMAQAQAVLDALAEEAGELVEEPTAVPGDTANTQVGIDPEDAVTGQPQEHSAMVAIVTAFKESCRGSEVQGMRDDDVIAQAAYSVREAAVHVTDLDSDVVTLDTHDKNGIAILRIGKRTSPECMHSENYTTRITRNRKFSATGLFRATLLLAQASESIRKDLDRPANHAATVLECISRAYSEDNQVLTTFNERVLVSRKSNTQENKVISHQVDVFIQYTVRGEERFIHAVIH